MSLISFLLLLVGVGGVWLVCGLGLYVWLGPVLPQRGAASAAICAVLGLALLGAWATQVFYWQIAPVWALVLAGAFSLALMAAAWRTRAGMTRALIGRLGRGLVEDRDVIAIGLLLSALLFYPGYRDGLGQPFRLGIDQVGYAAAGQYLREGGTRSALAREIVRQTGQPDLAQALNAHITALSFNVSVASEFLLKAHRFGYPGYLAGVTQLLGFAHVADLQFCLLAVPWLTGLLALVWLFRDVVGLPALVAKIAAVALAVNANQLNVLFEGQHAQVAIWPLLVLLFGGLYLLREGGDAGWRLNALVATAGAGIFALYSDAFIALGMVGLAWWAGDLLSRDWPVLGRTTRFGLSVLGGVLVLNVYTLDWSRFIFRHLGNLGAGNGGWAQPHWASPAEILGYLSMYLGPLANTIARDDWLAWVEGGVVAGMAFIVMRGARAAWRNGAQARFWLMPAVLCLALYVDLRFVKGFHNYGFMKVYTLLLIPLAGLFWTAVVGWSARVAKRPSTALALAVVVTGLPVVTGLLEVQHFARTSERIPAAELDALERLHRRIDFSRYALITYPEGGVGMATLSGYVPFNWLTISWADKYLEPHLDKPALILAFGSRQPGYHLLARGRPPLYRGSELMLVEIDRTVKDLDLPECHIVADRITTQLTFPQAQGPVLSQLLRERMKIRRP